jgi:hypothetical protein
MALAIGLVAWGLLCLLIDRSQGRIYRELRRSSDTLESCRVLLKHIAENMQRGDPVDLQQLFFRQDLAKIFGRQKSDDTELHDPPPEWDAEKQRYK